MKALDRDLSFAESAGINAGIPHTSDLAAQAMTDAALVHMTERVEGIGSLLADFFFPLDECVKSLSTAADRIAYCMTPGKMSVIRSDAAHQLSARKTDPLRILEKHGVLYYEGYARIPSWFRIMPDGGAVRCNTIALAMNNILATTAPGLFQRKDSLSVSSLYTAVDSVSFTKKTSYVVSANAETALLADIVVFQIPDYGNTSSQWDVPLASLEFTVLDLGMLPVSQYPVTRDEVHAALLFKNN